MYYKYHKVNPNRFGSYIDSPDWVKTKKQQFIPSIKTINNNKCSQYTVTVELNHEEIKKDKQRITKNRPFIDKYNWEGINYLLEKDDWKKLRKIF